MGNVLNTVYIMMRYNRQKTTNVWNTIDTMNGKECYRIKADARLMHKAVEENIKIYGNVR